MHILKRKTLADFWASHKDAEQSLKSWLNDMENTEYQSPAEIKLRYHSADILPDNRVVFNIKGNHYRLVVKYNYHSKTGFIRFIGTHAEYDKIDAEKI